jgi:hypothetical protein
MYRKPLHCSQSITKLEKTTILLSKTIKYINNIQDKLNKIDILESKAVNKNVPLVSERINDLSHV